MALKLNDEGKVYLLAILAKDREDEAERLVCPTFKEIGLGERFGGLDLAIIYIGYVQFLLVFRNIDDWIGREIRDG